ncbi:hypothetical protein [Candidatus Parabeggiatoa sp. HSG14]|uniref:hypothetical protein n=1 Tax=Candidatus Parabeggiatoa sp. HSG14 TaxID=3055593 RepID=UPI0025A841BA|nr:hypothetical protein [Thiotrichales bacterium HSG14]
MKKTKTLDLPLLEDVVVPGKDVPIADEFPPLLSEIEIKALQQQIEKIVKAQLESVLKKVTKEAVKDIKNHLDKVLPELIKAANKAIKDGKLD